MVLATFCYYDFLVCMHFLIHPFPHPALTGSQEIEAIKARVKEMEEEAEKLKEMQGEVEKQMMTAKSGQCLGLYVPVNWWKGVWVQHSQSKYSDRIVCLGGGGWDSKQISEQTYPTLKF